MGGLPDRRNAVWAALICTVVCADKSEARPVVTAWRGPLMQMTAELFEKTVRSLKVEKTKGTEQRRHPRVGIRCRLEIFPVEESGCGKPVAVWSKDISEGGIALISPVSLAKGKQFIIRLPR